MSNLLKEILDPKLIGEINKSEYPLIFELGLSFLEPSIYRFQEYRVTGTDIMITKNWLRGPSPISGFDFYLHNNTNWSWKKLEFIQAFELCDDSIKEKISFHLDVFV